MAESVGQGEGWRDLIKAKAVAGDFSWMVEPFDWLLIQKLPEEGTNVGGLYQLGKTIAELVKKDFSALTPGQVSGRMRSLESAGMVRQVRMVGGRGVIAWQQTTLGKEKLDAWLKTQA